MKIRILICALWCMHLSFLHAQTALTSYTINNRTTVATSNHNNISGWNITTAGGDYLTTATYNLFYGQAAGGGAGLEREITGFNIGTRSFSRPLPMTGSPFNKVVVNRHPHLPGDTINTFYEFTTSDGQNLYMAPSYVGDLETIMNSYICNRGSDNIFSNAPSTRSNIERIDLIQSAGINVLNSMAQGLLINERGGNDNFKVAAITSLNGAGNVATLGSLLTVPASAWGRVGPMIRTRVMSRRQETEPFLRPKQDIDLQPISGVYISLDDLGIPNGSTFFGFALFPNDVTASMDLIGLTDVPTNTDASGNGGLDMVAGVGYFVENILLPDGSAKDFGLLRSGSNVTISYTPDGYNLLNSAIVQRSSNGIHFTALGDLMEGTPSTAGIYTLTDELSGISEAVVYYRIAFKSLSGNTVYSRTQSVRVHSGPVAGIRVFPNPFTNHIQVTVAAQVNETATVQLLAPDGTVLLHKKVMLASAFTTIRIEVPSAIQGGNYYLQVITPKATETRKLVKR